MYYLINTNGNVEIKEVKEPTTDATYHNLKQQGFNVRGQFGRLDFAEIWKDFYNGKISREQLKYKLN